MAAAKQLGAKMKKMQIPDVDPVSNIFCYTDYVTVFVCVGG